MKVKLHSLDYKTCSDEKLMQHICSNDISAFNELYKRYNNKLLYYFYRMLGNSKEKSQDFLQELFYKIIEKPAMFDTRKKFSTWIYSVAHNMCKNEYRGLEVRKKITNNDSIETFAGECLNNPIDLKSFTEKLYKELNKLDENQKTAFIMKYREGFKIKEISKAMNCSEGTVKSRLFYTSKKLAVKLKEFCSICCF